MHRFIFLLGVLLLPILGHSSEGCFYFPPCIEPENSPFFVQMIQRARTESFKDILNYFENNQNDTHQFHFKYPIKNEEQAHQFVQVLHLKAREAHHFVPVISHCQPICTAHLGFYRLIKIVQGPEILEHVLVDSPSNTVIFVEEQIKSENGVFPGSFTALNQIIEENGQWFFQGFYLYQNRPSEERIQDNIAMFWETYQNMTSYIEDQKFEARLQNELQY